MFKYFLSEKIINKIFIIFQTFVIITVITPLIEAIPILETAISKLKSDFDEDYWSPTEGNTKRVLNNLLTMCKMRPNAIIDGD